MDSADKLHLLTVVVPLIGYIAGGVCLLAGLVLLLTRRQRDGGHVLAQDDADDDADAKVKV